MGAFFENPMFFFVDDAEPILPIFRPYEYGYSDKIVELMDAECDTETTFPVHLSHGAFKRHRRGAENFESTRRNAKWYNGRSKNFARDTLNNYEIRNGNYNGEKALQNDRNYVDVYIDIDYDSEEPYKNLDLSEGTFAPKYKNGYYSQYVASQNKIGCSQKKHFAQYSRDPESPFARSNRVYQRENPFSQRYADEDKKNLHEIHTVNVQPRQTKILSKADEIFDHETDSDSVKNYGVSQRILSQRKRLHNFDTQQKRDIVESEKEESEDTQKNSQKNFSPKTWTGSARYQSRKSDAMTETPEILQLNTQNTNFPQVRSAKTFIDEQILNRSPARKHLSNARYSAIERKMNISSSPVVQKKESVNATSARTAARSADNRQYREKFVNKLSNKFLNETVRSAKTFKRIADSKSDERTYTANERNNTTLHRENSGNSKIDRINVPVSQSTSEEKVGKTERIFSLRMTGTPLRTKVEKEKKRNFSSRLPIRTWKRLRTKEPAALRFESNTTNEKISEKLQEIDIEAKNSKDHSKRVEDNEAREKVEENCATANRSDIKRNNRSKIELFGADKPRLTSSNLKDLNAKGLNTTKGIHAQRNKRINIK